MNYMILGDNGSDPRSPLYTGKDHECEIREGTGRVTQENEEGEYETVHCDNCKGEGVIEDEGIDPDDKYDSRNDF